MEQQKENGEVKRKAQATVKAEKARAKAPKQLAMEEKLVQAKAKKELAETLEDLRKEEKEAKAEKRKAKTEALEKAKKARKARKKEAKQAKEAQLKQQAKIKEAFEKGFKRGQWGVTDAYQEGRMDALEEMSQKADYTWDKAYELGYKEGKTFVVGEEYENGRTDAFEEMAWQDRDWENRDRRWNVKPPLPPLVRQRAPGGQPQAPVYTKEERVVMTAAMVERTRWLASDQAEDL